MISKYTEDNRQEKRREERMMSGLYDWLHDTNVAILRSSRG
jgi:hypothetical protein